MAQVGVAQLVEAAAPRVAAVEAMATATAMKEAAE